MKYQDVHQPRVFLTTHHLIKTQLVFVQIKNYENQFVFAQVNVDDKNNECFYLNRIETYGKGSLFVVRSMSTFSRADLRS